MKKGAFFVPDLADVVAVAGLSGIFYGLYIFQPWLAFTVCGGIVFGCGMIMGRR